MYFCVLPTQRETYRWCENRHCLESFCWKDRSPNWGWAVPALKNYHSWRSCTCVWLFSEPWGESHSREEVIQSTNRPRAKFGGGEGRGKGHQVGFLTLSQIKAGGQIMVVILISIIPVLSFSRSQLVPNLGCPSLFLMFSSEIPSCCRLWATRRQNLWMQGAHIRVACLPLASPQTFCFHSYLYLALQFSSTSTCYKGKWNEENDIPNI